MWEERGRRGRESGPCGTGHCRQPTNEKLRAEPASSLNQEPARVWGTMGPAMFLGNEGQRDGAVKDSWPFEG